MQEQQSTINQGSSLWIGLDSYKESNSGIFFGRDEEIRQLSGDIFNNIQTVIYGPSGTGKTSIIRAGIFKIARANRYLPVYVRLNHKTDSKTYTQQIIEAIRDEAEKYNIDIDNTSPYIEENVCQSLWEYFHCNEFWNEENYPVIPLIVVDQFEEIFTLGKNLTLQPDFFVQLSDLCDNKYPQYVIDYLNDRKNERIEYPETINYRFVISLREDFLARLEEQAETIPALKRNRFSLQCINEEQALDIILKPQPGLVSEDVAALIIEKVTNKKYNEDFKFHDDPEILVEPAILSLFCRELDKKRREKNMPTLSSDLIGEFGDNIIRDFYINSLSSLSEGNEENNSPLPTRDEKIDYLESRLITVDGFRDAVAYQNAKAFGFTKNDIQTLISNRLVRIDEWDGTRRIEFIHDVLCKVANKHRKEREREKENKEKEEEAKRLLEEEKAKREKIAREAAAEKEAMERKALRIKKRNRRYFWGVVVFMLFIIGFSLYDYYQNDLLFEEYYEGYVLENGWPKGVGKKMSKQDAYRLTICYRLWKKGASTEHFNNVGVYGRGGQQSIAHTPINNIVICEDDIDGGDINASKTAILLAKTHYIYFRQDSENNEPVQQLCYDKEGHDKALLYTINLSKEGDVVWMVFCDSVGRPFPMRDNGADRLKVLRAKNGLDSICYIFDGLGIPQYNSTHYYGQEFVYNNLLHSDTIFYLDQFGLRRKASTYKYPSSQSVIEIVDSIKSDGIEPLFTILWSYDIHGDCVKKEYLDLSDKMFQKYEYKYDDWGRLIFRSQYDAKNNQTTELQISYMGNENYDIKENMVKKGHGTSPSYWETVSFYRTNVIQDTKHIEQQDEMGNYSHQIIKQIDSETEEIRFVNLQGQPIIDSVEVCHRKVTRIHYNNDGSYYQTEYYYGLDGKTLYSSDDYPYAVDSMVYDSYGHRIARVRWDKDMNIITSYRIEYERGRESFRYAMGVEGKAIRCPDWECEGLNYYKLQTIRKSDGKTLVYLRAIDEYGLPCILCNGFSTKGTYVTNSKHEMGMGWSEIRTDSIRIPNIPKDATSICYLHILNKDGEAYKQGLKDGDILAYKEGTNYRLSSIKGRMKLNDFVGEKLFYVIRYNPDLKKWSSHEAQIHNGQISGAEVYPIFYSQEEMIVLNKALSQLK